MNIKRFIAANSRAALRQVRDALGGDAIILSNRAIDDGVEVLAARAGDLEGMNESASGPSPSKTASAASSSSQRRPATRPTQPTVEPSSTEGAEPAWITQAQVVRTKRRLESMIDATVASDDDDEATLESVLTQSVARQQSQAAPVVSARLTDRRELAVDLSAMPPPSRDDGMLLASAASTATRTTSKDSIDVGHEIRAMRDFMEDQFASLAFGEALRRDPTRLKLMQDLLVAGFSPQLGRHLQQHLPQTLDPRQARDWVAEILRRNVNGGTPETDLMDQGGVFALVGPTGVGKTTTAAKLAARFAVKHGVDKLALITTDGYRIGAQDQLRIYGKILGIPVHSIHDEASLASAMTHLRDKRLVLIDTAGLAQRDDRVAEQIAMLRGARAKRLLVLNATVQAETLEDVTQAYVDKDFLGCVITKLDEAVRLAPVLDVAIRHRLKIHYVANGQRVPEDIHHPNTQYLVHRALKEGKPVRAFQLEDSDQPAWLGAIAKTSQQLAGESMGLLHV